MFVPNIRLHRIGLELTTTLNNDSSFHEPHIPRRTRTSPPQDIYSFLSLSGIQQNGSLSDAAHIQQKKHNIIRDLKRAIRSGSGSPSKLERRAKESAEIVRTLIIGPNSISPASKKSPLSKGQLYKVKSKLASPVLSTK